MRLVTGIRLKEKTKRYALLLAGIGHPHRIGMLYLLLYKPLEAHDVAMTIDLPEPLVSHHLKLLMDGGWVTKTRVGRNVTYAINERNLKRLIKLLRQSPRLRELLSEKVG